MKSLKSKTGFTCTECGASMPKWQGKCPYCEKWNCIVEESAKHESFSGFASYSTDPIPLRQKKQGPVKRATTGIKELDRVLGGGLMPGSYILLGGAPGMGKSTLLLHTADGLAEGGLKTLYVSAEESLEQTGFRADRLKLKNQNNVFILNEISLEKIFCHVETVKPDVLIIDSIQTVHCSDVPSSAGTVSQVRECAGKLMHFAKISGSSVFVIGHITKDGQLAGPRLLEHTVDTVLSFEGDPHYPFRLLRALKNRFGPVNEIGVFQMSSEGLKEVPNPSEFFLQERKQDLIGSVVFTAMEGSRPLLCEIQALCVRSFLSIPRRGAIGLDINRLHKVIAVLDRYLNTQLYRHDVFLNLAGGLKIREPGADLAIAKALISAKNQKPVSAQSCFLGEVGLTGEIRALTFSEERIKEAQKLGFKNIYLPQGNKKHLKQNPQKANLKLHYVESIKDLV